MKKLLTPLTKTMLILTLILGASAALAQPDPAHCRFPNHILVCPSGDISIEGKVHDINNQEVDNWSVHLTFSGAAATSLFSAPGYPFPNEYQVTSLGRVFFYPFVGGCEMNGMVKYFDTISGTQLGQSHFINSVDINGDGSVSLGDVSVFSAAFFGPYNRCVDFNGDGQNNLTDVSIFAQHFGH
ncbi:MAG: hypothetical protein GY780_11200 [bacterium]|nr:hypothetical protein [bacterium]